MKLLTKAGNAFDHVNAYATYFAAFILILIMLGVSAEVFMRYALNRPIQYLMEITEHLLLYMTFLAVAWVMKGDKHVKMDMALNRLNPASRALMNIITSIVGALICLTVTWYGSQVTWDYFAKGIPFAGQFRIPQASILVMIPIGYLLLFIQFLRRTYGYLEQRRASPA